MNLSQLIISDYSKLEKNTNSKLNMFFGIIMSLFVHRGFRAIFFYRVANYLYFKKSNLYYFFNFFNVLFNYIEISPKTSIGPFFSLPHAQNIVIGGGRIGANCYIFQGVTIGLKKGLKDYPEIGDNVVISAGSMVLGKVIIGNNCRIGANTLVINNNIPDNSIAAGSPAKIIKENI